MNVMANFPFDHCRRWRATAASNHEPHNRSVAFSALCTSIPLIFSIGCAKSDDTSMTRAAADSTAEVTLVVSPNYGAYEERYSVEQDTQNLNWTSQSSTGQRFILNAEGFDYDGSLEILEPKRLKLKLELTNDVPFQLKVEGMNEVSADDRGTPIKLGNLIEPGAHLIRIFGTALEKRWADGTRPADYVAETTKTHVYRGKPVDFWVSQIRNGNYLGIEEGDPESLDLWERAASDEESARWVLHAAQLSRRAMGVAGLCPDA